MKKQTVLWTTCPFEARTSSAGNTLHLSVVLGPRLWSDETVNFHLLGSFPDWLDWPAKIMNATFMVEFDGAPPIAATREPLHPDQIDAPDLNLWRALFDANTVVLPYKFSPITKKPQ